MQKKDLHLYDDSGTEVRLTLWGEKAADTNIEWTGNVVAFKGVKVGEYQGRTLGRCIHRVIYIVISYGILLYSVLCKVYALLCYIYDKHYFIHISHTLMYTY